MTDDTAEPERHGLVVRLPRLVPAHDFRNPTEDDVSVLGALMWAAYRGTPDERDVGDGDESATAEIRMVFGGTYGTLLPEASFVAEDGGRPVAAALVTDWNGVPLLAFVFTHRAYTGRGLGRRLIEASMHALGRLGYDRLSLAVTERNVRARALYESMGFAGVRR